VIRGSRYERVATHIGLIAFAFLALYPILRMLVVALQPAHSTPSGASIVPTSFDFGNITRVWRDGDFSSAFVTSCIISATVVAMGTLFSILAGYAFGTMRFPGSRVLFLALIAGLLVPTEAVVVPLYYDLRSAGLAGTYWSVIFPQLAGSVAFGTFWMRAFFASTGPELREAAMMDGASQRRILWTILVPLARPAIQTLIVLLFLFSFNDFLLPLVMLQDPNVQTVPLSVATFLGGRQADVTGLAAAGLIACVPVMVLYIIFQRRLIEGLLTGAIKE